MIYSNKVNQDIKSGHMRPLNLIKTLLYFFIPGALIYILFTFALEPLIQYGIPLYWATFICVWTPIILQSLLIFSIWVKSKEVFKNYFWISRLSGTTYLLLIGVFIIVQILETILGFTRPLLFDLFNISLPENYPALFLPTFEPDIPLESFLGLQLKGNYFALFFWFIWLIVNIFGEEFLWRGYALPRMAIYFGKWAWLINGLLWNLFIHFFMIWSFIALLPISLIVPYLSQKYKSMIPGLLIHGLGNILFYILLIPSVLQ